MHDFLDDSEPQWNLKHPVHDTQNSYIIAENPLLSTSTV